MSKAELVANVAKKSGLSQVSVRAVMEILSDTMISTLKKEKKITFSRLGIFEVVKRKKRVGRNPRTGEIIPVKAHKAVRFRPSKSLKETIK